MFSNKRLAVGRRRAVERLRTQHPDYSLRNIANVVDISRERVRQILVDAGLPTAKRKILKYCLNCGRPRRSHYLKYCGRACERSYVREVLICASCGKEFLRLKSQILAANKRGFKNAYCCRRCFLTH